MSFLMTFSLVTLLVSIPLSYFSIRLVRKIWRSIEPGSVFFKPLRPFADGPVTKEMYADIPTGPCSMNMFMDGFERILNAQPGMNIRDENLSVMAFKFVSLARRGHFGCALVKAVQYLSKCKYPDVRFYLLQCHITPWDEQVRVRVIAIFDRSDRRDCSERFDSISKMQLIGEDCAPVCPVRDLGFAPPEILPNGKVILTSHLPTLQSQPLHSGSSEFGDERQSVAN